MIVCISWNNKKCFKNLFFSHEFLCTPVTLHETSLGEMQDELSMCT